MAEEFLQIRLEVTDQHAGQYTLSFGSWQYPVILQPEASITFSEWLRRLRPVLIGNNDPAEDRDPQNLLRNVGTWLWKALLPESAPTQERDTLVHLLRTERTPLLLELPDVLARFPWELLCDPEQLGERGFLAYLRPLMRLSLKEGEVTPIELPLRVLLLISSPPMLGEDSRVDVESERAAVEQATHEMREAGFLHLVVEDIVTPKRVERLLERFMPHIVHYIGHGEYDRINGGMLIWEDDQGNTLRLTALHVASLLRSRNLHAVLLHGCETARSDVQAEILSLADTLVREGLPAVLAQQANFTYESSQLASRVWYKALATGQNIALGLLAVRQALIEENRPDWAVPILQGSTTRLTPVLDTTSTPTPGVADPLLTKVGAAADLPTPTEVFVGRHRELRALHIMLEEMSDNSPVLAFITGPGGMGKSTLAVQAVTRYGGSYKAALMLRCQEYQSIDLFLQAIGEFLKRLGTSNFLEQTLPDPKRSLEAKIEEAIGTLNTAGPVLLVIDNLESVQNEDQTISDIALLHLLQKLLTSLRGGRVLITSRYMPPDLLPQEKFAANLQHLDLGDLSSYEINQLLMSHPTLVRLSKPFREMLARDFGGLPYVYNLLSSKAATEDLEGIIYKIREYEAETYKVVNQERKQEEWQKVHHSVVEFATLEVIINHLSEASQKLLAQLCVLHRPFPLVTIEEGLGAARAVWRPLLDWSLLYYDPQGQSYHLHSLTRRYAEGLLDEDSRKQAQMQLATWYEHYAIQDSLDLADVLEAHRLLRAAGCVQQAGQMVLQFASVFRRIGLYPTLRDLCTKTLGDIHEDDEQLAANVLHELGNLAYLQGEYGEARGLYQQSLEICERLGDQSGRAGILHDLGNLALFQGEYEAARGLYQQSLEICERLGDQSGRAGSLHELGVIAQLQGEYEEARGFYQQCLKIYKRLGDQSGQANTLHQLGMIAQKQGAYQAARGLYQQCLEIYKRLRDQSGRAKTLHQLGMIDQNQGKYQKARGLYQQSLEIHERLGDQSGQANTLHQLGLMAQLQGEYEEARTFYQQCLEIFERLGDQSGRAKTLHRLGSIARDQGEYQEARAFYQQCLEIFERLGDQSGRANILHELGLMAQLQGEYEEARGLYQQSLEIHERLGDQSGRAGILHELGRIAQEQGEYEEARGLYQQSLEIFERLGDQRNRAVTLHHLGNLAYLQGEYGEARRVYLQNLEVAARLRDQIGRANSLGQLGLLAYEQRDFENALIYTIQAYLLVDALRSPDRVFAQHMLSRIRSQMDEETFMAHWQKLAGSRPLVAMVEQEGTDKGKAVTVEELPSVVSAVILQGTFELRQQFAANLVEAQQRLPKEAAPMGRFLGCLVAALRGETPQEVASLEAPFAEWWQAFQDTLNRDPVTFRESEPQVEKESVDKPLFKMSLLRLIYPFYKWLGGKLLGAMLFIILRRTIEDRQKMAAFLIKLQQHLPRIAFLELGVGFLMAALRGETPEVLLGTPLAAEWVQIFLSVSPDKSSQQEEGKDDQTS